MRWHDGGVGKKLPPVTAALNGTAGAVLLKVQRQKRAARILGKISRD